jgi:hypothetical protein
MYCWGNWKLLKRALSSPSNTGAGSVCWIHWKGLTATGAAAAVRIPVEADAAEWSVAHLPAGIFLQADSLRVDFKGAEDLLGKLFELAQTVGNDFQSFKALVERSA